MTSFITRAFVTVGATAGAALLASGVAAAHVTVDAPGAQQGGYAVLTFKVPTESDTAGTTKLTVTLPGFKSARTEPIAGWKSEVVKNQDAEVTSVTWTADPGVSVPPGQFQRFALSVGPLPDEAELSFNATQTYSDGEVVNWDQPTPENGEEPEHPAPAIMLAEASEEGGHGHSVATADNHEADNHEGSESEKDTTARWLGGIGLALGALGAALGLGAVIRSRRS